MNPDPGTSSAFGRSASNAVAAAIQVVLCVLLGIVAAVHPAPAAASEEFDFKRQLFGPLSTLAVTVESIDHSSGKVAVNGCDTQCPTIPFDFDWGDNVVDTGWFPREHVYQDLNRNYLVTVTASYGAGRSDDRQAFVRFRPPVIEPISLPARLAVSIPHGEDYALAARLYPLPTDLVTFDDTFFPLVSRDVISYVLSLAAVVQHDFANGDLFEVNAAFRQLLLRDADFVGGMYSLWYTTPLAFASGDHGISGSVAYSSFFHEMGHNLTLNSPAACYYGGKIDGNANAIYSETMANIFAHATTYDLLSRWGALGLRSDLATEIRLSAVESAWVIRRAYEDYLQNAMPFTSWNKPKTPEDETFTTFMTLAFRFMAHAEEGGAGYTRPLRRMMELLQLFDQELAKRYDRLHNNTAADTFRATLMVAALSHAFERNLCAEFTELGFPICHETYDELLERANNR